MNLSAKTFHATVASIKPIPGERRQNPRVPFRFKVKIIPYEDGVCGDPIDIWTRDISATGIGLIYHKAMREGRKFIIRLTRLEDTPILLLCTVRNCVELATDVYGLGASFAEVAEASIGDPVQHGASGVSIPFVAEAYRIHELTDEIRRISDAILS